METIMRSFWTDPFIKATGLTEKQLKEQGVIIYDGIAGAEFGAYAGTHYKFFTYNGNSYQIYSTADGVQVDVTNK